MKKFIQILTLSFISLTIFGQKDRVRTTYYSNGQIYTCDSIYDCDTIRMSEQYYTDIVSIDSGTIYSGNNNWTQLESKGEYLLIGERTWTQYGNWTFWDINGNIRLETYEPCDGKGTRYINQWEPNGKKTINSGIGYYYTGGGKTDSVVYEIRDSIRHGYFEEWKTDDNGDSYYLYHIGIFDNNQEKGLQTTYYRDGSIKKIFEFHDGTIDGLFQEFYKNGKIKESGQKDKHNNTGNWKYWNENGVLIKECNYLKGSLIGKYTEYYSNGILKQKGNYIHISGQISIQKLDPNTIELIQEKIWTDDIPVKNGQWQYFNEKGEIKKIEFYTEGKLKK